MGQLEVVSSTDIFNSLSKDNLKEIFQSFEYEIINYKKDELIVKNGEDFRKLGIVLKGKAIVLKSNIKGRDTNFSILKETDVFGMASLFESGHFNNSIKALNNVKVLYFNEEVFMRIIYKYPDVSLSYIKLLTRKINFLTKRIDTYLTNEKSDGLYDYLLNQRRVLNSDNFKLDISLSKLANMLHMSRSSLYRSFDELIENGLIEKENKVITIKEIK